MRDKLFVMSQYLLPQSGITRGAGQAADYDRLPLLKNKTIRWFIRRYGVAMSEAANPDPAAYASFNEFFTRPLRDGIRPVDTDPRVITSPVDGAISQVGDIAGGRVFQAKGQSFSLRELLGGDADHARPFENGQFATIYLAPKDYHRIHMPLEGALREMIYIPGRLFSVNPATASHVPNLFARNERVVALFDTAWGPLAMVLVGAMIVGSVETTWAGVVAPGRDVKRVDYRNQQPVTFKKGEEMGRFRLGSTVVMLMPKGTLNWRDQMQPEAVLKLGEGIGDQVTPAPTETSSRR